VGRKPPEKPSMVSVEKKGKKTCKNILPQINSQFRQKKKKLDFQLEKTIEKKTLRRRSRRFLNNPPNVS